MNQSYLNCPSVGRSMTAEEFAAQNGRSGDQVQGNSGCCLSDGVTSTANLCQKGQREDGCEPMICCCRPVHCKRKPVQVEEGCCCKKSFRAALELLCDQELSDLLDFNAVAFFTDQYTAGVPLDCTTSCTTTSDNLACDPTGVFKGMDGCSLLDINALVYSCCCGSDPIFMARQISLCDLDALVLQISGYDSCREKDPCREKKVEKNFQRVRAILSELVNPGQCSISSCRCKDNCHDCDDCCCAKDLLSTLSKSNLSRRVSLVAGQLVVNSVTLLGTVGNVLVLSNDKDKRIYFVCVNSVQFLA